MRTWSSICSAITRITYSQGRRRLGQGRRGRGHLGLVGGTFEAVANILVARKSPGLAIGRSEFNPNLLPPSCEAFGQPVLLVWASVCPLAKSVGEMRKLDRISGRLEDSFLPGHVGSCGVNRRWQVGRKYNLNLSSLWREIMWAMPPNIGVDERTQRLQGTRPAG